MIPERVEKQWKERYKRIGFTQEDVEFYENVPQGKRQSDKRWRSLDNKIWEDFKNHIISPIE